MARNARTKAGKYWAMEKSSWLIVRRMAPSKFRLARGGGLAQQSGATLRTVSARMAPSSSNFYVRRLFAGPPGATIPAKCDNLLDSASFLRFELLVGHTNTLDHRLPRREEIDPGSHVHFERCIRPAG